MCEDQKDLSDMHKDIELYPQVLINVRLIAGFDALSDEKVQETVRAAEARLGDQGRILLRKSGTEPLVRVMAEGYDAALVQELASGIADVIVKQSQN